MDHHGKRPMLKGLFHLFAMIIYITGFTTMRSMIPVDIKFSITIYLVAIIFNFGASAVLHIISWPDHLVQYLRRIDHIIIFGKIAATYYAIISTVIPDINLFVIYILIIGSICGIISRIFFTDAPQIIIGIPYLIVGWSILLDPHKIIVLADRIPIGAIIAFSGGISYTIGALVYIFKYPRLCPTIMGYHELFHIFTIIGTSLLTICIFQYAIPYHVAHNI